MRIRIALLGIMVLLFGERAFAQSIGAFELGLGYGGYQRENIDDPPFGNNFVMELGARVQSQAPVYYSFFARGSIQVDGTYGATFLTGDLGLAGIGFYLGRPMQHFEEPEGRWFTTMDIGLLNLRYSGTVSGGDSLPNAQSGYLQIAFPVHVQAWYMYTPTLGLGLYGEVAYVGSMSLDTLASVYLPQLLSGVEVKVGFSLVVM